MMLSATQKTAFVENGSQMGIPHETSDRLQNEQIIIVTDLIDFDKSTVGQIDANIRRPVGKIYDPNPGAALGAMIPLPPFVFGTKSQERLVVAAKLLCYYETVVLPTYVANIQWNPVINNFEFQWKALDENKDRDESEIPNIMKAFLVIKQTEAFT